MSTMNPPARNALRHAIEDLLAPQMPLDEALDRHFAPAFASAPMASGTTGPPFALAWLS